jgi:hypothetical protein
MLQHAGTCDSGNLIEAEIHLTKRPKLFRQIEPPLYPPNVCSKKPIRDLAQQNFPALPALISLVITPPNDLLTEARISTGGPTLVRPDGVWAKLEPDALS